MTPKSAVMLRVLLNRYHRSPPDALMRTLPASEAQSVRSYDVPVADFSILLSLTDQLKGIHYSWFTSVFKKLSPIMQTLVLNSLSESQYSKLTHALGIPKKVRNTLPKFVQNYVLSIFSPQVKPNEILPVAFLPQTQLTPLTNLSKHQLVELIDFLGIHDLAEGIRHIINKNFLSQLYNTLSAKKKHWLRTCLHKPEKIASTRLEIEKWNGDPKKLDHMLQRRGLHRLGKALCGQHPHLVWHIAHTLDSGRGEILLQNFAPQSTPGVTQHLVQQVVTLVDFLNSNRGK